MGIRRSGGGDMVLESRHLIGLFLLLVVIFGVVFTLGYLLGRSQYDTQLRAAAKAAPAQDQLAEPAKKTAGPAAGTSTGGEGAPAASDWDFYRVAEPKKTESRLEKPAKSPAKAAAPPVHKNANPAGKPAPATKRPLLNAPLIPKGAIVLQVAALTQENDALALAEMLQQKKFPAFVLTPTTDKYYRVQVGPYADAKSATAARSRLEHEGFKSIVKH